jgi:ubiquinone/menaquinone biosynthesis C-methylase UbiE
VSQKNFDAWSFDNTVNFYVSDRSTVDDLYDSEKAVLLPIMPHVRSILDIGCAVGNFYDIFKSLNPDITYVGIDSSSGMIDQAKERRPDLEFHVSDGGPLQFADNSFDLVFCTGVLHHNPDYQDMIKDQLRVSKKFVIADMPRLVTEPYTFDVEHSYMLLNMRFPDGSEGISEAATKVPYVLANIEEAFSGIVENNRGTVQAIAARGYTGSPHGDSVQIPIRPVIFTVTLLVKGEKFESYWLDVPEETKPALSSIFAAAGAAPADDVAEILK